MPRSDLNDMKTLMMAFFAILCMMSACDFNLGDGNKKSAYVSLDMTIYYKNSIGENLLNPETDGHYSPDEMEIYYEQSGEAIRVDNGYLLMGESNGEEYLVLWPDTTKVSAITTTYLKLSEGDMDTIQADIQVKEGFVVVGDVWYNGELVVGKDEEFRIFTVVK